MSLEVTLVAEWRKDMLERGRLLLGQLHEGFAMVQMRQEKDYLSSKRQKDRLNTDLRETLKIRMTNEIWVARGEEKQGK